MLPVMTLVKTPPEREQADGVDGAGDQGEQ